MKQSRLVDLVNSLSKSERSAFEKEIKIRARENSDVYQMWKYLKRSKNELTIEDISYGSLVHQIGLKGNRKYSSNLGNKLLTLIDDFLIQSHLQDEKHIKNLYRFKIYNQRGLYKHADSLALRLNNNLDNDERNDFWLSYVSLFLNHLHYFSNNPIKLREGHSLLRKCINSFETFSSQLSSFYRIESFNRTALKQEDYSDYEKNFELLSRLKTSTELGQILENLFDFLIHNDSESYVELKSYILNNTPTPHTEIDVVVLIYLTQYLINDVKNNGSRERINDVLKLYEHGIESGKYLHQGKISDQLFINIVTIGSYLGKVDWASDFVNKKYSLLHEKNQSKVKNYCQAEIAFYNLEYELGLELIRTISFTDLSLEFQLRALRIVCIFEYHKTDVSFINTQLKSLESWVKAQKNKMTQLNRDGILNLCIIIKMMLKNKSQKNIQMKYQEMKRMYRRAWVENKIEAMKI